MSGKNAKLFRRLSRVVNTTPRALERAGEGHTARERSEAYGRMRKASVELEQKREADERAALFEEVKAP